jgi:hypothetical protein
MAFEQFDDPRSKGKFLRETTLETIQRANVIIQEYQLAGYTLTLRQLYYQFVSRGWIKNSIQSYKRLTTAISTGRIEGLIDWDAIEDRVRSLRNFGDHLSPQKPAQFMPTVHKRYREDIWRDQNYYCEVWLEKDALIGVAERACAEYRVPFFACRGYNSQTSLYDAGKRLEYQKYSLGKEIVIFHLGDHDPSGQDMTRDNEARLAMFSRQSDLSFRRIALNEAQISQYKPPPMPAKEKDSRYDGYVAKFGEDAWELDALEPSVLVEIIHGAIEEIVDIDLFREAQEKERINRAKIEFVGKNFDAALKFMEDGGGFDNGFIEGV